MEKEINRWYKKLWETKGSRFIAANRLELHDKWSTITISIISVYIISINLAIILPKQPEFLSTEIITYSTICLSILVLVVSLILTSRSYRMRADKYHECGRKINEIYDQLCIWKNTAENPNRTDLINMSKNYYTILDNYENHSRLDYLMFIGNNLSDYKVKCKPLFWIYINIRYYLDTVGRYLIFLIIPIIVLLCL
jgi:uncharacterized membrane protein (DUF485 family)